MDSTKYRRKKTPRTQLLEETGVQLYKLQYP